MDVFISWIIQLVYQNELKNKNQEHEIELHSCFKFTILQDVSENDNLVQKNQLSQIDGGLSCLLLRNGVKEFLLGVFKLKRQEVLWSLNKVINLVFCGVLDYKSIVEVEIIVESKYVHGAVINLV